MSEINWNQIGLSRNPFNIVPDRNANNLIWAGFPTVKSQLEEAVSNGLNQDASRLTLIVSRYGGGKTHSSFFYSNPDNLPHHEGPTPLSVVLQTPKDGSYAADEFYVQIIERLKISNISDSVEALRQSQGNEESLVVLQQIVKSEDLGRVLWLLGDDNGDIRFIAEQVLMATNPNSTTKNKLRIRRGIQSNSDKSQILSGVFWILNHYDSDGALSSPRKIQLWIDELESLIYYTSKQYRPFTQAIRELIDFTTKNLCVFMNFSFSDPSDVSNVEIVIGEALLDRISDQIVFEEASIDDSRLYVQDLIKYFQIDQSSPEFYPLNEEIVNEILNRAPEESGKPLMPRSINKWFHKTFNELNQRELLGENSNIQLSDINDIQFHENPI